MRQAWPPELSVPAEAETVIDGCILALVRRPDGPLGTSVVCYGPARDRHVFEATGVS
jgi:UbiD family decarboxylase